MKRPTILLPILATCLAPALLVGVGLLGCNPPPGGDESGDPAAYALDIKTQVTRQLTRAKANPATVADSATVLIENLEGYEEQPVGEHGETYAGLLSGCQELKEMCDQSAGAAKIGAKIDEILALAGKLPGQVTAEEGDEEG